MTIVNCQMSTVESMPASPLIAAVEQADSPSRLVAAVRALADARLEAAIPTLIAALGYNNPAAAAIAVEGLIHLGPAAVQPILDLLDGYNYGARAWAIRALGAIADPRALDTLLHAAANDFAPSVRRAAAKGLGAINWQQLPGEQAGRTLAVLQQLMLDADWSIRYAAIASFHAIGAAPSLRQQVLDSLQQIAQTETDPAVLARLQLACQTLANT